MDKLLCYKLLQQLRNDWQLCYQLKRFVIGCVEVAFFSAAA